MNPCSSPNFLSRIELNELIGKSLNTININFNLLKEQICKESNFLSAFKILYLSVYKKMSDLSYILKGNYEANVLFDSLGNILKQKKISSVQKKSLGNYQINFSSVFNDYIISANILDTKTGFVNIVSETPTSVTITVREQNGNLFDPEKISLIFFT